MKAKRDTAARRDSGGPDIRPFTASLPMGLLRAREATMRHFRPLLSRHQLTEQQWRVLRALAATDEDLSISEVAERTFLLAPSLTRIVGHLEAESLVDRRVDPDDNRRSRVRLSHAGHALVQRVAPESEASYNVIEQRFGAERLDFLLSELAALEALAGEPIDHDEPNDPEAGTP